MILVLNVVSSSSLISEVIYFADHEPQGLMKSLDANLPAAQKVA